MCSVSLYDERPVLTVGGSFTLHLIRDGSLLHSRVLSSSGDVNNVCVKRGRREEAAHRTARVEDNVTELPHEGLPPCRTFSPPGRNISLPHSKMTETLSATTEQPLPTDHLLAPPPGKQATILLQPGSFSPITNSHLRLLST